MTDIPERPWLLTDDLIVARLDAPQRLVAYDIHTGKQRWTVDGLASSGYATPDGRTVVVVVRRLVPPTDQVLTTLILAIDAATGSTRVLSSMEAPAYQAGLAPLPAIWPALSGARSAVIGDRPLDVALNGWDSARADTIDLATSARSAGAVKIDAAFDAADRHRSDACPAGSAAIPDPGSREHDRPAHDHLRAGLRSPCRRLAARVVLTDARRRLADDPG